MLVPAWLAAGAPQRPVSNLDLSVLGVADYRYRWIRASRTAVALPVFPQGREQLVLGPGDELVLQVGAHLNEGQVGEAGVGELPRRRHMPVNVRAARNDLGDGVLADLAGCGVEGARIGQRSCSRRAPRKVDGVRAGYRDPDLNRGIRQVVELGAFHLEVAAAEADVLAGEQGADDLGRFAQPLMADPGGGPATADHVLVEVLARAQAEGEPVSDSTPTVAALCATTAGW